MAVMHLTSRSDTGLFPLVRVTYILMAEGDQVLESLVTLAKLSSIQPVRACIEEHLIYRLHCVLSACSEVAPALRSNFQRSIGLHKYSRSICPPVKLGLSRVLC